MAKKAPVAKPAKKVSGGARRIGRARTSRKPKK
jgi:hypothetical protein